MQDAGGGQRSQRTGTQRSQEAAAKRLQVSMQRQARASRWETGQEGRGRGQGLLPKGRNLTGRPNFEEHREEEAEATAERGRPSPRAQESRCLDSSCPAPQVRRKDQRTE